MWIFNTDSSPLSSLPVAPSFLHHDMSGSISSFSLSCNVCMCENVPLHCYKCVQILCTILCSGCVIGEYGVSAQV